MIAILGVLLDVTMAHVVQSDTVVETVSKPRPPAAAHTGAHAGTKRSGARDSGAVRKLVALGDSVPAGSACDCTTYVSLIGEALAARQGVEVDAKNLAAAGLTTQGLLDQLEDDSARQALVAADLTIITIGANDFDSSTIQDDDCAASSGLSCYKDELAQLRANMDAILTKVRRLQGHQGSRIVVTGYWNVFMDGAPARAEGDKYVTNSDKLTRAVNDTLAASADAVGARFVDLYTPFKGDGGTRDDTSLLADDGDHPDASGHRVIAREVLAALATA
ncbi:SGNH/GDSL hydrolase family protein [Sphaerisporangium fuscum]|uniref:SGNH/GDSL hydrolase family protein n=1 Tax=Sphaerisporangium fuscum TaxID=2835868 RepID=UPI001BDD5CC3|nr:GDSL-type esterase/lipase family protein [Sphaerisporangium fuscum]